MIDQQNKGTPNRAGRHNEPAPTDAIGSQLKRYYTSLEEEPIPDNLLSLLEQLDQAERSGGSNGGN